MKRLTVVMWIIAHTVMAQAATINIPTDEPTIQAGIDASTNGDTVLVQPGTYVENINFDGKNVMLGSWILTTNDTSYISQTVIDGNRSGSVVTFENGEDSTAVLMGFTIQNGQYKLGGGIRCSGSSPDLRNLIIRNNVAFDNGGGFYCSDCSPILSNVVITDNSTNWGAGGFGCHFASPVLNNVTISNNKGFIGGIFMDFNCYPVLTDVIISSNTGSDGGGMAGYDSSPTLSNVTIKENRGAGIYFGDGGFTPIFDVNNRCNIYLNKPDLETTEDDSYIHSIVVDTFTVMNPTWIHANPIDRFTFDILNAKVHPVAADLYVNPAGNNANSGLSATEPLKSITYAMAKITADSLQHRTIYLANGRYSPSTTGELFPIHMKSYVSLIGESQQGVIWDAEGKSRLLRIYDQKNVTIDNMTLTKGWRGAIRCSKSSPLLSNLTIDSNQSQYNGGGISLHESNPILKNLNIRNNKAHSGGGIYIANSNPYLTRVTISNNTAENGGGIYFGSNSRADFDDQDRCNIYLNKATRGRDLYADYNAPASAVVLDTFTVKYPTDYHAFPLNMFTFDILNGKVAQVAADLFVSPAGNNNNSGLMATEPLQNIQHALEKIYADSLHPRTIHLANGHYSPSLTGELFPLDINSYITLRGESMEGVILNAEVDSSILVMEKKNGINISNLTLTGGRTKSWQCVVLCLETSPKFDNVIIKNNAGGAIGIYNGPFTELTNVFITGNTGRGLRIYDSSSPKLTSVVISENTGGGILCAQSNPHFSNVTVKYNSNRRQGGGIYFQGSKPVFDNQNRCNIYNNKASAGKDLYVRFSPNIAVVLDTFTVMNPTEHHAFPMKNFTFDILYSKETGNKVNADLYVSPHGDDTNSGLSASEPLKTIATASARIFADSLNPHTIYVKNGVYTPDIEGETFPVIVPRFVNLVGESTQDVVLDADRLARVVNYSGNSIKNMTIKGGGGNFNDGAAIYCLNSNLNLENVIVTENGSTNLKGGVIHCENSSFHLLNVTVSGNHQFGLTSRNALNSTIINSIFWNESIDEINFFNIQREHSLNIAHSNIVGGHSNVYAIEQNLVNWLPGNIDKDPLFVDPDNGDYGLLAASPCIDAGIQNTTLIFNEGQDTLYVSPLSYKGSAPDIGAVEFDQTVGVAETPKQLPTDYSLLQNYPNPFNPTTTIEYALPKTGHVQIEIYDVLGRHIKSLVNTTKGAGQYQTVWDGTDENHMLVAAGVYFYKMVAGDFQDMNKLLMIK